MRPVAGIESATTHSNANARYCAKKVVKTIPIVDVF